MSEDLHPRRLQILKYLAGRREDEPPSIAEVAGAVGLRSTQTAHHHLIKLEAEDYLERPPSPSSKPERKRRPVNLTEKGWEAVGRLPMLGRIAAGRGLEAVPVEEDYYSHPAGVLSSRSGRRRYTLTVVGQSMTGAGIEDGDVLVVEERENPPEGSVVVALLDGGEEVTVKRLYRDGEMVRLVPQNGHHEEIIVPAEEVRIQGEVVLVLHPPRR